jgi:antitoxin ParD1/3/4
MNVSLTPELEKLVNGKVASGDYASPGEVIAEGLRLLSEQDRILQLGLERLRREVAIGLKQLDAGRGIPGDHVFQELQERSRARRAAGK